MRLLHYLEIENFKRFGERQRIELEHPAVLIGPNNCGKTSAIQALALWSFGIKTWYSGRRDSKASERVATALNRLSIVSVPVTRTRFFWKDARVRTGNQPIIMSITVGVEYKGKVRPVTMKFKSQSDELAYCEPGEDCSEDLDLIQYSARLNVELLYSMSGIETEEPVIKPGRINVLLGQGQTAQVLRNLCLIVARDTPDDWRRITGLMKRLFGAELMNPVEDEVRGVVELFYRQPEVKEALDISMAGRGFQQMLLILSYLFSHKRSILLIDEPDAHLEILRQRQVYVLLRDVAHRNESQVVMVTHSEVVLNEAIDTNLTLILDGQTDQVGGSEMIRNSLKHFGAEHYVRARQTGTVLYVEGSTDIDMLRGFARKLDHPVAEVLEQGSRLNTYYLQDNYPQAEREVEQELERVEGGYGISARKHFFALRDMVPNLRGLALRDGDARRGSTEGEEGGFREHVWKRYEPENYFVTPELLSAYAMRHLDDQELFEGFRPVIDEIQRELLLERVFGGAEEDLSAYLEAEPNQKSLIWRAQTSGVKLSDFAEEFFRRLAAKSGTRMLLRKGELHLLIDECSGEHFNGEIREVLDLIAQLLSPAKA
ncbi:ATP-dependent nuclease [Haloferula sp. A504]|uniref:ATP-dependent nuclease n=1 Tax=Haloferula sp. A504 TaxID=3373601 RepID=UPI0031C78B50|nr:AAA family ATPase [Verrucomicrobiaceae bacterium E54]